MTIGKVVFAAISARIAGVLWVTIISGWRATSSVASLSISQSRSPAEIQSNTKFCPCIHPRSARTLVRVSCVRTPKMLLGRQGSTTKSLPNSAGLLGKDLCYTHSRPAETRALGGGAPPARHHGDAAERDYMVRVERIDYY